MIKKMTCIACPQGCQLTLDIEKGFIVGLSGNKCPKGEAYGKQEIENPLRTLSTTVLAEGLELRMVPVRTNRPIPKTKLIAAMAAVKSITLTRSVKINEVIISNFLDLKVDLLVTRTVVSLNQPPAKKASFRG
jgi:CxxC motif-containing protein